MLDIFFRTFMSFIATIGASVLFGIPRKEIIFCAVTAGAAWFFYDVSLIFVQDTVIATFFATLVLAACARFLCYKRKVPVTVYLVTGIFPIVPGAGIYYTMYEMVINDAILTSIENGITTMKSAGVIAVGIIIILSLPKKIFTLGK